MDGEERGAAVERGRERDERGGVRGRTKGREREKERGREKRLRRRGRETRRGRGIWEGEGDE